MTSQINNENIDLFYNTWGTQTQLDVLCKNWVIETFSKFADITWQDTNVMKTFKWHHENYKTSRDDANMWEAETAIILWNASHGQTQQFDMWAPVPAKYILYFVWVWHFHSLP